MADVTGTIGNESVALNNAATEATLRLLLQATLAANKQNLSAVQQLAQSSGLNPKTVQAASQGLTNTGQAGKNVGQVFQGLGSSIAHSGGALKEFDSVLKQAIAGTLQTSDVFRSLSLLPGPLGLVASGMARIAEFQENNMKTYQQISSVGANFTGSLTGMRQAAAGTMMTLDQFGAIVTKNSETLAMMGGGVDAGTRAFTQLSKQLLTGDTGKNLMAMGYTTEQVNQGLLNYISVVGGVTSADLKNAAVTKQLTDSAGEYLGHLDGLARLTGKSREAQQAEIDAASKNAAFQSYLQTLSKSEQEKAMKGMASAMAVGGKGAVDAFQSKLMGIAPDKAGAMFIATAGKTAKVVDDMAGMVKDGNAKSSDMNKKTAEGMRAAQEDFKKYGREGLFAIIRQGGPTADALQQIGITANKAANMSDEEIEKALKKVELQGTEAENMAAANASLKELGEALIGLISPIVSLLTPAIKFVAEGFAGIAKWFNGLSDSTKIVTSSVVAATAAILAWTLMTKKSTAAQGVSSVAQKIPGSPASGAGGAGGLGGMLQGLGQGTQGVLEGLAKGLASFSNPQILLGATIFGSSIAVIITTIGAGIAAASWLMGKALPTLSEGINSFTAIDGDKLTTTAKGITALGAALTVFSATGAVASVGNVFSSIVGGVTKFFGGDDIITKIQTMTMKLAPIAPTLSIVGPSIQNLGTGLLDFSKAINQIDIAKAEKVRELLSKFKETGVNSSGPLLTSSPIIPTNENQEKANSMSAVSLNKTMEEMLKYTKEMADNTKRTMEGIKALKQDLFV